MPILPYRPTGTTIPNVCIGLINRQSICNKSDEVYVVVEGIDPEVVVITDTGLTGNHSDQIIVGGATPAGY